MEAKAGQLIKTIMPAFPEGVFDADTPILKDAMATKAREVSEKFGKYGSLKAPPADINTLFSAATGVVPAMLSGGINNSGGISNSGGATNPGEITNNAMTALHDKAFETMAIQESFAKANVTVDKLASVGISQEKIKAISGMSPEQLNVTSAITSEQLSIAGIKPEQLGSIGNMDTEMVSPEQLKLAGISEGDVALMSGLSPEQISTAISITPEQLMAAGVTNEQLSVASATSFLPASSVEQLAIAGVTPEQIASGELKPEELASKGVIPEKFSQGAVNSEAQALGNVNTSPTTSPMLAGFNAKALSSATKPNIKKPGLVTNQESAQASDREPENNAEAQFVAIRLVDDMGLPICGHAYEIKLGNGSVIKGSTDENGSAFVPGITPKECTFSLLGVDSNAW